MTEPADAVQMLRTCAPSLLDPATWHQKGGGEVVGGLFGLSVGTQPGPVDVQDIAVAVVDGVLELVSQAEALAYPGLGAVQDDQPATGAPGGAAGDGQIDVGRHQDARQLADQAGRCWWLA